MKTLRSALLALAGLLLVSSLAAAGTKPGTLDDGKLDPSWFGDGAVFREVNDIDYLWVVGDFDLAGKSVSFPPWPEPEFLGENAKDRDLNDHNLAKRMNNDMADLLRFALAKAYGKRLTMAEGKGEVRVEGRIVDASTGSTAAKLLVGFGAGSGNVTIDLRFVDEETGAVLAGFHHRVVSGTVYSTSDSKFIGWLEDMSELLAKKGLAQLYAKGDKVKN